MSEKDLKRKVLSYLNDYPLMVLATVSSEGRPLANSLYFHVDEDFNFYFITRSDTQKTLNIAANDQVALSVSFEPPYNVEVSGQAEVVTDSDTRSVVMDRFVEKSVKLPDLWPPIFRYSQGSYVVYRVRPERVRLLDMTCQHIYEGKAPFADLL